MIKYEIATPSAKQKARNDKGALTPLRKELSLKPIPIEARSEATKQRSNPFLTPQMRDCHAALCGLAMTDWWRLAPLRLVLN
ncbi:hypothetical protein H5T88_03945 [bacterium]|nr:hypothetical protein [bacterium]